MPDGFGGLWRQAPDGAESYARALYAELRLLDAAELDLLLVEAPPRASEWEGVNDRLQRATHPVDGRAGSDAAEGPRSR